MNNLKKRFLGSVLAAASLAATTPAFAVIPHDVAGTRYEEPIQVLSALKIMIGDDTGSFRPNDSIIRSEVAKIAVHTLGLENAADSMKGQSKFPDVSLDHWANGYINLATSNGIVIGDDTGNFRPNDKITYAEAMTMLVRILGYEPQALQNGGFPNGYIKTGTANGLNKNVTGSANEFISRGNVAYMTNNALTVNLMEQKSYGSSLTYEVTDKTLLKDKLNVTKGEGQITAIDSASITGTGTLKNGQIRIGTTVYDTAYNMNNLLGYNVVYYIDESDNNDTVILAMPASGKNTEVIITADLFEQITTKNGKKVIEYYKSEEATAVSTAEIDTNAAMLYNGKSTDYNEALLNINGSAGKVTLLDTDKSGKYDKLFVTEYRNMFVNNVTSSGKITDKYGNASITLDENVTYRITRGLEEIKLSDIKENDVLSVAESLDKELFEIAVSNEYISGKITGTDSEGIFVDSNHYKLAPNFKEAINVGDERIFYLDIDGKIAGTDKASSTGTRYAYLTRAYNSSDDEVVRFKLFTVDNEEITVDSNEKIRFNDSANQYATNVIKSLISSDGTTNKQLVTYKTNADGKLTEINTATDNSQSGTINENIFAKNFDLNDAIFNKSLSKLNNVKITSNTIIFEIPADSTDYAIRDITLFEDEQKYNAIAYDVQEDYTADVIVVTNANLMPSADAAAAVVKSIATSVNSDNETTHLVTLLINGKEEKILAEDTNILVKQSNKVLECGDIIQYKTNSNTEITSIRLLFDISKKAAEAKAEPATDLKTVYGKVQKKFTSSMNVTVNSGSADNILIPNDCKIYTVDTSKTKNNVAVATKNDIYVYDEADNNRVFVTSYKDTVKEIIIVK